MRLFVDDLWPEGGIRTFSDNVIGHLVGEGHQMRRLSETSAGHRLPQTVVRPLAIAAGLRSHELFFNPGFYPPVRHAGRSVVVVHDLNYLDPEISPSAAKRHYFARVLQPLYRRCDLLLTVSAESRDDIVELLGDAVPVSIVGDGVDDSFFTVGDAAEVPAAAGEVFRLIYVGNFLFHKRVPLLVEAAALASADVPIELSIPQPDREVAMAFGEILRRHPHNLRLVARPPLSSQALAESVAEADLLVTLSMAEGFGLPPLEAQAAGTPALVTQYRGAVARYRRDGAHYVPNDPSVGEVAEVLRKLAADSQLLRSTVEAGRANAADMSWRAVGERVSAAIHGLE